MNVVEPHSRANPSASELWARSETYLRLFERTLAPGPRGAIVEARRLAPIHQYWSLNLRGADTVLSARGLDAEVSAWGSANALDPTPEPRFDADVTVAYAQQRVGPAYVRMGRQQASGGAARFVRFDGVRAGIDVPGAASADAYLGWTALPRFDKPPTYRYLGSDAEARLEDPEAVPPPRRSDSWLGGGRVSYASSSDFRITASYHEERESAGLSRRDFGADLRLSLSENAVLNARAIADADSMLLSDAQAWLEVAPTGPFRFALDYARYRPSRLLPRSSVIAVFSTEAYDEVGGELTYRPLRWFSSRIGGYVQPDSDGSQYRAHLGSRIAVDPADRLHLDWRYSRVRSRDNGYHAFDNALAYAPREDVETTLRVHAYAYDRAVLGRRSSLACAATLAARPLASLKVSLAFLLFDSPWARADLQTTLSVIYDFGGH